MQKVWPLVDETRSGVPIEEVRIRDHRLQERDVRRHPPHPELGQRPVRAAGRRAQVAASAGELHQHRVEVRPDRRAGEHDAAVQADARAARGSIDRDHARVGTEAVGGVLGRDAALQRGAANVDGLLAQPQVGQRLTGCDPDLRADQVDVGDLFGDRVLHLDARVHLDKDVVAVLAQQEFHGAGVHVADVPGELHGISTDPCSQVGGQVRRRRDLDHLLVATLHRAVALEQVDDLAGRVAEHLHLDVPGPDHRLLQVHPRIAERGFGFAHRLGEGRSQLLGIVDPAHAASATAADRLHEDREADLLGGFEQGVHVVAGSRAAQRGQPRLDRRLDRPGLVAGEFEHLVTGTDELDAGLLARLREIGVLG